MRGRASVCVHFIHECFGLSRPNVKGNGAKPGSLGTHTAQRGLKGCWRCDAPPSSANKSVEFSLKNVAFNLPHFYKVKLNAQIYSNASAPKLTNIAGVLLK